MFTPSAHSGALIIRFPFWAVTSFDGHKCLKSRQFCCTGTFYLTDWQGHENAVFDVDWVPGENRLVTASGDQSAILWDVETQEKVATFRGHTSSVRTVNCLVNDKSKNCG